MPTRRQIFLVFLKTGAFSFGGVYSMLTFFQRELVDRRGWFTDDEFAEGVAIGQMTPGPPIVNTAIYFGYRLGGPAGGAAATAGVVLPGLMLVLVLGWLYLTYRGLPAVGSALGGVAAAVVGLLLSVIYRMGRRLVRIPADAVFAVSAFALIYFARLNPIALIAAAGAAGYAVFGRSGR